MWEKIYYVRQKSVLVNELIKYFSIELIGFVKINDIILSRSYEVSKMNEVQLCNLMVVLKNLFFHDFWSLNSYNESHVKINSLRLY